MDLSDPDSLKRFDVFLLLLEHALFVFSFPCCIFDLLCSVSDGIFHVFSFDLFDADLSGPHLVELKV